jgi:hypothetical protein
MKGKLVWSVFWALVGVFVIAVTIIFTLVDLLVGMERYVFFVSVGIGLTGLGVTLLVLTAKAKAERRLKKFLLLTGASAVGLPVFAILHNAVSALLNMEEAVFFTLATIVCPIGFLVGAIGSIVLRVKKSRTEKKLASSPE